MKRLGELNKQYNFLRLCAFSRDGFERLQGTKLKIGLACVTVFDVI